ncbi:MAG: hypothetical protein AAFV80_12045 [Bacteroidota bacterium]
MKNSLLFLFLVPLWGCPPIPTEEDPQEENPYFFWSVDWHPTTDQIVVGGMQDTLRLFSATNLQLLQNCPYKGTITKTKWHPNSNKLAVSVQDGKSYSTILDLDTNQSTKLENSSPEGARAIGWNSTGTRLAVGDYEGFLTIFDDSGNFLKQINTQEKSIIGLDWHPSDNRIAAVGENVILYDLESDSLQRIKDRDEEFEVLMLCVAWHPDGHFFATGDYGDFLKPYPPLLQFWNEDGQKLISIEGSKAEYRNLKWSNDGELLATASEKIRLWNSTGDLIVEQTCPNLLWGIDWKDDGSQVVATDENGKILIWDRTLQPLRELKYPLNKGHPQTMR